MRYVLKEIKNELLNNTDAIVELLEYFGFAHIKVLSSEIRFARDEDGGRNNIRIKLTNNDYLNVQDFVRSESCDIFSYIIKEKNSSFKEVIQKTKSILGINEYWEPHKKKSLFGGFYDHIIKQDSEIKLKVYDENILDEYNFNGNKRFLRDGISITSQKFFGIRFCSKTNRIIIPIRNEFGELVGVKGRYNGDVTDEIPKYIYPVPVMASQVLYGYSENYDFLYGAEYVYVGESEKFVMQCHTMGIRTCVGLGSHSLSVKQAKLIVQLCPKCVVFMLDEGLDLKETKKNADILLSVSEFFGIKIKFFDYRGCLEVGEKDSPSDNGINAWNIIVDNYIKDIDILSEG